MQFNTGLLTLALAVAGATSAPALEERQQQIGIFLIQFFTEPGCQPGTMVDAEAFLNTTETCQPTNPRMANYPSWRVRQTDGLTQPFQLYSRTDCTTTDGGAVVTVPVGTPIFSCFTQKVGSAKFGSA